MGGVPRGTSYESLVCEPEASAPPDGVVAPPLHAIIFNAVKFISYKYSIIIRGRRVIETGRKIGL